MENSKITKQNEKIRKKQDRQKQLEKVIESHSLKYYGYFIIIFQILIFFALLFSLIFSGINLYQNKKLISYIDTNKNIQETQAYKKEIVVTPYDNISDLSGTTWVLNDNIYEYDSYHYEINFTSNNDIFSYIFMYNDMPSFHISYDSLSVYISDTGWYYNAYKTIQITGGDDALNTDLISWLQANATLQNNTPTPTQLTSPTINIDNNYPSRIVWSAVSNATGYKVYKDGLDINATTYTDGTNIYYTASSTGHYQVQATGDGVNYDDSALSNTITLSAITLGTPNLLLNVAENKLFWGSITNANGYYIYKDNVLIDNISSTNYVLSAPYNGSYYIVAYSNSFLYSNSSNSNVINALAVSSPSVTYSVTDYRFTWSSVSNATAYEIYNNNTLVTTTNNLYYEPNLVGGSYTFRALGDSTTYMNSSFSSPIQLYSITTNYNYSTNSDILCSLLDNNIIRFPYLVTSGYNLSIYFFTSQSNLYFISGNFYFNTLDNANVTETIITNKRLQVDITNITNDIYFELTPTFAYSLSFDITNGTITELKINNVVQQTINTFYYINNSSDVYEFTIVADTGYMYYNLPVFNSGTVTTYNDSDLTTRHYSITDFLNSGTFILEFDEQIQLTGQWAFIGSQNFNSNNLPSDVILNISFNSNNILFNAFSVDSTNQIVSYIPATPIIINGNILHSLTIFTYTYDINNLYFAFNYVSNTTANYLFIDFNNLSTYISSTEYYNVFTKYFRVATNQDYGNLGYQNGVIDSNQYSMASMFFALFDTPIIALKSLLNFNFFGVNLFALASALITLLLVFAVFNLIKGGSSKNKGGDD